MSAKVTIRFIKRHGWHRPLGFEVYHCAGSYLGAATRRISGAAVRLFGHAWERAGFAHGRFGFGSFGWAQGGSTDGGFGYGRFGSGEFGYYNEPAEWTTPRPLFDGQHTFGVVLLGENRQADTRWTPETTLVMSRPAPPGKVAVTASTVDSVTLRWTSSIDLANGT